MVQILHQVIYNPFLKEWLATGIYLLTAIAYGIIIFCSIDLLPNPYDKQCKILCWGFALILILLGINKQLDLQVGLTQFFRTAAKNNDWYDERFTLQILLAEGFGIIGFIILLYLRKTISIIWRIHSLAFCGLIFLICLTLIDVVSFHHIDSMFNRYIAGLLIKEVLEIVAIGCIWKSAFINIKKNVANNRHMNIATVTRYL